MCRLNWISNKIPIGPGCADELCMAGVCYDNYMGRKCYKSYSKYGKYGYYRKYYKRSHEAEKK